MGTADKFATPQSQPRPAVSRRPLKRPPPHSRTSPFPSNSSVMSTNNSGVDISDLVQQTGPDTGPANGSPSQKSSVETTTKDVQQTGPDTEVRPSPYATEMFRAATLPQARAIVSDALPYVINLSKEHLWKSYLLQDQDLSDVRRHLVENGWLTEDGRWDHADVKRKRFTTKRSGDTEVKAFGFLRLLFNTILDFLQRTKGKTFFLQTMVDAGSTQVISTRISTHRADAFLYTVAVPLPPQQHTWKVTTCPFEYKFGNGDAIDVSWPNSIACQNHVFNVHRTTPRHCGTLSTSCGPTPAECSRLDALYKAQSSASGCYAGRHPSYLPPLTGSMSV